MRKLFIIFIIATSAVSASAQENIKTYKTDSELSRWSVEVNLLDGVVTQDLSWGTPNYTNMVNTTISGLKFNNGSSVGFEGQLGYFFGHKRHFGIGLGVIYENQTGNVVLDKYHIEYQKNDSFGSPYRQIISSNSPITETDKIINVNIPLVVKYRKRFSKLISFNADAGVLFNVQMQNTTTTNAVFNYEGVTAFDANGKAIQNYDNSVSTSTAQVQFTQAYYLHTHPDGNFATAQTYFNALRTETGQNLGLGISPNNNKSTVSYTQGNIGFLIHPAVGIHLTNNILINVGVYYMFQPFKNSFSNNYKLTDKIGDYSSVLNGTNSNTTQSYGGSIGLRYYITKGKTRDRDSDHDGVNNRLDRCPHDSGVVALKGCPDKDGDGIPDIDDSCADVAGLAQFNGCPDTDGDGIPDKNDACPTKAGLAQFNGCPDTDGDGIADKDDLCPFQAGPAKFNGCPDSDGDGIPDNLDKCPNVFGPIENQGCPYDTAKSVIKEELVKPAPIDVAPVKEREVPVIEKVKEPKKEPKPEPSGSVRIAAPILFEINKAAIRETSKPVIAEAVKKINANPEAYIIVEGYTDTTGPVSYNKVLSKLRANILKKYLVEQGVNPDRIRSVGMGSKEPAADNKTRAGRTKNRRAEMKWAK